jgi:hypothetical protein
VADLSEIEPAAPIGTVLTKNMATAALASALGGGLQFVLLSDLVADSWPTHIMGARVFLIEGYPKPAIGKIGLDSELRQEMSTLGGLPWLGGGIRLPRVLDLRPVPGSDWSVIVLSFEGLHTLDSCRLPGSQTDPARVLRRVLSSLSDRGLFWCGLASRNIIVGDARSQCVSLVDWERGYERLQKPRMPDIYARSIELLEETSTLLDGVFPYWARDWPTPADLRGERGAAPLLCMIEIGSRHDTRTMALQALLDLPLMVTDAQYFRLVESLCSLTERRRNLKSLSYAGDQIEYFGGLELRLRATLLARYLEIKQHDALWHMLSDLVIEAGFRLSRLVHSRSVGELEVGRANPFTELELGLAQVAISATASRTWWQEVVDTCREDVLVGIGGAFRKHTVLAWL